MKNSLFQANLKADRAAVTARLTPFISHAFCYLQQWKQCHFVIYRLYQGFPRGRMDKVDGCKGLKECIIALTWSSRIDKVTGCYGLNESIKALTRRSQVQAQPNGRMFVITRSNGLSRYIIVIILRSQDQAYQYPPWLIVLCDWLQRLEGVHNSTNPKVASINQINPSYMAEWI